MTDVTVTTDLVISRLAREVARNLQPVAVIRENFKLTAEQMDAAMETPFFQQRLTEEIDLWSASDAKSIVNRIGAKAATMVEECIPEVFNLIHDRSQPMAAKIEALKWASRMAGADDNANVKNTGEGSGVKIIINVGDRKVEFEKTLPPKVIDGDAVVLDERVDH